MRPPAQAMTIRLSPVNSSAPPITTRIRPSEKTTPPATRIRPKGADPPPVIVTVMKIAPKAMKAPARTARVFRDSASFAALAAPIASHRSAISGGISASMRLSGVGFSRGGCFSSIVKCYHRAVPVPMT